MKALSIDDSPTTHRIIASALETIELDLISTANAQEAFAVLEHQAKDISIILLDWNMPEMNGLETLKVIKVRDEWKSIPVIMLTSETNQDNMLEAIQEGAINYITKPFSQENLIIKVMKTVFLNKT